jgi:hypothetical protein
MIACAKFFGVFRVKNPDFMPKNLIFSNFRIRPWYQCLFVEETRVPGEND